MTAETVVLTDLRDNPLVRGVVVRRPPPECDRLRALLDQSPVGIFECDAQGGGTFVNERLCSIADRPAPEFLGSGWTAMIHPDDVDRVLADWTATVRAEREFRDEYRVLRPDGTIVQVSARAVPLRGEDGMVRGFLGTIEDITDLRAAEEALRASEERFQAMLAHSTDVVAVLDEKLRFTYLGPNAERLLGYPNATMMGTDALDLIHPDDVATVGEVLAALLETGALDRPVELRARHTDGSWRHVEIVASNLLDHPAVGGIVLDVRDISERRKAEADLREAELRFQQAFDHAPIGMALADVRGHWMRVNPALSRQLGYPAVELVGRSFVEMAHPDDRAGNRELLDRLVAGEIPSYAIEKRFRSADGSWLWVRVHASLVRDATGAPRYLIGQVEDVQEQHLLQQQLEHDATHDRLTGLPNRTLFSDHLRQGAARARRTGESVGVLLVDLDRFKQVNDTLGHAAGDEVLVEVADRLRSAVRAHDTPARFGGDEFVIACPDVRRIEEVVEIAERVGRRLRVPFDARGHEVYVSGSIGIAFSAGRDADPDLLLRNADVAAYRAKERGRDRYEIFDEVLRARVEQRARREGSLRRALAHGEPALAYAPVVELGSGRVFGLAATPGTVGGGDDPIAGAELVEFAGDTGLAADLTRHLLARALEDVAAWATPGPDHPAPAPWVGLPVSTRQFEAGDLADDVARALARAGVDPARVCLDIAEDALVADLDAGLAALRALRRIGVRLGIADFGAGRSALADLRRLEVDVLTLHPSFVAGVGDGDRVSAAIVASVIRLARTLGVRTVAAGVETRAQAESLRRLGCHEARGPYAGPAVPAAAVPALLAP